MIEIRQRNQDGVEIVELEGEAGSAEAWEVQAVVSRVIEARPKAIVFDMTRLSFISSLALAELIRLANELARFNTRVSLAGMQPKIREVLHVLRIDQYYEIHNSVDEAVASASRHA